MLPPPLPHCPSKPRSRTKKHLPNPRRSYSPSSRFLQIPQRRPRRRTPHVPPPVPSTLAREVPEGGSIVAGQYVPAGASVGVSFIGSQFSADNFHLPYEFHPERWLSVADVEELKSKFPDMKLNDPRIFEGDDKKSRQPFSYGPANCIGKNLAYAEMRVLLGNVVWGFDLEGVKDSETWLERNKIYVLWKKPELWVKLKRVNV